MKVSAFFFYVSSEEDQAEREKNMNRKILFFDIDGTLIDFNGRFPESAKEALNATKAAGHKIIICSGRNIPQIYPEILNFGFDGFVSATGAYAEVEGTEVFHAICDHKELKKLIDIFEKNNDGLLLQNREGTFTTPKGVDSSLAMYDKNGTPQRVRNVIMNKLQITETLDPSLDIEKMYYYGCSLDINELQAELGDYLTVTASSYGENPDLYSGEITITGISKAVGMEKVLEYYGADRKDSIGFGDAENDIEMMQFAGFSVAMGNAKPVIKELSDYVTADVNDRGIAKALKELKLI